MSLGVYWDREEIGKLQLLDERSREYYFQYTNPSRAISLSLPISEEPFTPAQTRPFFEALLPEGAVRQRVAIQAKLLRDEALEEGWHDPCIERILGVIAARLPRAT